MASNKTLMQPITQVDNFHLFLGVLWQQRDKVFSRWKERYFVLTCDYLQCFKKSSPSVMHSAASEMGRFIFKLKLTEVGWVLKMNLTTFLQFFFDSAEILADLNFFVEFG